MFEETAGAIAGADEKTEETRSFIKQVRRITRRKFTTEEKIRIVLELFRYQVLIRDLCRREGIRPNVYYAWLRDFREAGKVRLARNTVRDATRAEADSLQRKNERLKDRCPIGKSSWLTWRVLLIVLTISVSC